MFKGFGRIFILIAFLCTGKSYAQSYNNKSLTDCFDFFENKIDSLYKEFNKDLALLMSDEDFCFDSLTFVQNLKKHRMKMSMARESFIDSYLDSINKIQHIYFRRFNTAEEYAIMFASLLYCRSAIDIEWICLDFCYMLYFFPNKIFTIEQYAKLLGHKFSENFIKYLAYICAIDFYETILLKDPTLFRMFYPYFYSKYGDKPYECAISSGAEDWIDWHLLVLPPK